MIMTLIVPIMVLAKNLIQGNKAPMPYLFTASRSPAPPFRTNLGMWWRTSKSRMGDWSGDS